MKTLADDPYEKYMKRGPHDYIRGEELRLQGCRFISPDEQTPEQEIDKRLNDAIEAINAALTIFDTSDIEGETMLHQAVTLISRVQRRLS